MQKNHFILSCEWHQCLSLVDRGGWGLNNRELLPYLLYRILNRLHSGNVPLVFSTKNKVCFFGLRSFHQPNPLSTLIGIDIIYVIKCSRSSLFFFLHTHKLIKVRLVGEGLGNEATVAIWLVHNCYTLLHLYIASQRAKEESLRKMKKLMLLNHLQRLVECTSNMLNPGYGFVHTQVLVTFPCYNQHKAETRAILPYTSHKLFCIALLHFCFDEMKSVISTTEAVLWRWTSVSA